MVSKKESLLRKNLVDYMNKCNVNKDYDSDKFAMSVLTCTIVMGYICSFIEQYNEYAIMEGSEWVALNPQCHSEIVTMFGKILDSLFEYSPQYRDFMNTDI